MTEAKPAARVEAAVARFGSLRSGSALSARLLAATGTADTDLREVASLIGTDPGLTLRVLRVANSPYYGQSREVATVPRAIALLGLDTVRVIAAAACLDHSLVGREDTRVLATALLRHSLFCAEAARRLAEADAPGTGPEAFMAGLLHDIGCAVLLADRRGTVAVRGPLTDVEHYEIADLHAETGAALCAAWRLPDALRARIARHHDGGDTVDRALATADALANALGYGHTLDESRAAATGAPGAVDPAQYAELVANVEPLVQHWLGSVG
jgi:HD-like signal output (HDOD) protein